MKKAMKKGFTLVELLVVIAILSILATVSIVGYTSFLERATVSNDQSVASQLNKYLTATRVDSTSEFYGESVTPENVWAIVNAALNENGSLDSLEPQSLGYGYNFFFKFNSDGEGNYSGGEIVLAKAKDVVNPESLLELIIHAEGETDKKQYEDLPGFFYDGDDLYFLLDTTGSDLAIAVRGFYTTDGVDWDEFKKIVMNSDYEDFAKNKIFVMNDGKYCKYDTITGSFYNGTELLVHENVVGIKKGNYDIDLSKIEKMNISSSVKFIDNDVLNELGKGLSEDKHARLITSRSPAEIAKMIMGSNESGNGTKIYINETNSDIYIIAGKKMERQR